MRLGICALICKHTHLDLCGCVLFPGSSKVHAEFEVRHDWQGCPSSHLIRLRLESCLSGDAGSLDLQDSPAPVTSSVQAVLDRILAWQDLTCLLNLKRLSFRMLGCDFSPCCSPFVFVEEDMNGDAYDVAPRRQIREPGLNGALFRQRRGQGASHSLPIRWVFGCSKSDKLAHSNK